MNTRRHRGGPGWTIPALALAAAAGLALWGTTACRSEREAAPKVREEFSLASLTPVFGEARDANSGLADFTESDQGLILSYHFYLTDRTDADQEIARELAPKIRRLYGRFRNVDRVSFEVSMPDKASPDYWSPYVSFSLTRKIVKRTGWTDLLDTDLLGNALNVRRTR
ncbi:MAG TPA: hypothetical protein PLP83_02995 [Candidatus Aminicenantes bacterium]|nr:hypothetical protein [Candidatus Aminicenantes bacterium]